MTPKIILLKSGERIIAAVGEINNPETNTGVGLIFKCPYILSLVQNSENSTQYNVNFTKWIPYSSDEQFKVPYDSVTAVGEVESEILEIYINRFGDKLNDTDTLPAIDPDIMPEESAVSDS